jgi:hypothetical protein
MSHPQIALPFNHLAHEAFLYAPFSVLRYQRAYCVFLIFNLLLMWLAYRCLSPYLKNLAEIWRWLPAAIFIGFIPAGAALMQGQDSICFVGSFRRCACLARTRPRAGRRCTGWSRVV